MTAENLGRLLLIAGCALALIGLGLYLGGKLGFPFGRLPGDLRIEHEGGVFHFPITSSIMLSILLTIVVNLVLRVIRK